MAGSCEIARKCRPYRRCRIGRACTVAAIVVSPDPGPVGFTAVAGCGVRGAAIAARSACHYHHAITRCPRAANGETVFVSVDGVVRAAPTIADTFAIQRPPPWFGRRITGTPAAAAVAACRHRLAVAVASPEGSVDVGSNGS